jgi:phage shock protein C
MVCGHCHREVTDYSNFCYYCGARQPASPYGPPRPERRLMRSVTDCKIAGVCGGIAEYLELDSTLVRVIWVLLVLMPVPLVLAVLGYFVAWLVMPKAPWRMPAAPAPPAAQPIQPNPPHSTQPA